MNLYRGANIIGSFPVDENTVFFSELMGADKITAEVVLDKPLDIQIGDYIFHLGVKYYVNDPAELERNASYTYNITFYGESYLLYNKIVRHLGRATFSYTGRPLDLCLLIRDNMRQIDPAWKVGEVPEFDEPFTFSIDEMSCRTLLTTVAEEFGLEYSITDKTIRMAPRVGVDTGVTLEYGRAKGLYALRRRRVDSGFGTVWYGYGGAKNIPLSYRDGLGKITFDESPVQVNVAKYGYIEATVTFEDVFPNRTGTVEAVDGLFSVTDSTLDFDLNETFITDGGAKIVFKSGALAGQEFPITQYDHSTKVITFGTIEEDSGYVAPNATFKAAVGDTYTLVGIEMPESYITAAEQEVKTRTIAHAEVNATPKYAYEGDLDEKYVRQFGLRSAFKAGNSVIVQDESLGIEERIRIQSIEYPIVNPDAISIVISESRQYTKVDKIAKDTKNNLREVKTTKSAATYAKLAADEIRNYAVVQQFKKTFVGDRAIMTGVFVAGNPDLGGVAGISGLENDLEAVRIWAGSSFDNRGAAPFRVQQDGKAFASALEVANGCKIGVFQIEGGYIKSSDYGAGDPTGILISNDGIASRNAGASFISVISGIDISGSFWGSTDESDDAPTFIYAAISAGMVGVRWSELVEKQMQNIRFSTGKYGGFFSSQKNIGNVSYAMRGSSTDPGTEVIGKDDHMVVIYNDRTAASLPDTPDHGMEVIIKNGTSGAISVERSGTNEIADLSNATVTSYSLPAGQVWKARFQGGSTGRWIMI
ncbi:hypothetical protein Cycma_0057 [Cyclobacterium marinum DSM 745]|uniref:Prophage tail endopeptidase domain-containing protein n=2 Tax=Cyclobacterium marinum TaxID=104 RepID=G0IZ63_CYCMS|nr:hypothetical protein Cycma_0057 [Cyclobacterium marinum DSM 745]